jgi:recombination protein RecT
MAENNALALPGKEKLNAIMRAPETLSRFVEVLGERNASAYVTSVLLAVANNDDLQKCSPASIITSAMRAATLRLSCDPMTKQAHLVPFKTKIKGRDGKPDTWGTTATLVVGYKGYYDMANRTNRYRVLNDFKVYEGQEIVEDQLRGSIEIVGHRTSETVIGYGFYFEMTNGLKKVLYMTVEEIKAHGAAYSKTFQYDSSMWKKDFPAMARKTVIRLCLSRYGYLDPTDAANLSAIDDRELDDNDLMQIQAPPRPRRSYSQTMRELGFDDEPEPTRRANVDMQTGELLEPVEGKFEVEFTKGIPEAELKKYQQDQEALEDEEENGLDDQPTAALPDPYADLKAKAEVDPKAATRILGTRIGWNAKDVEALSVENNGDWTKTFAALLKNAPPAMI